MVLANESLAVVLANPHVKTCETHVKLKQKSQATDYNQIPARTNKTNWFLHRGKCDLSF